MKKVVFVVDDNDFNLTFAASVLEQEYTVLTMPSAEKMFSLLEKKRPDLILLDVQMPDMTGFEAMEILKGSEKFADIPVIFLTALTDADNEARGIELGAVDFIMKPFSEPVLLQRIKNHLNIDRLIKERTEQLVQLKNGIVFILADLVESRDQSTGGHVDRTAVYMEVLINAMLEQGVYADEIGTWDIESAVSSSRLHDIGKITISDTILNKAGKLTDEEFEIMKTHSAEGGLIIDRAIERTGDAEFLHSAKLFAVFHHEKWNGAGYPMGLEGDEIPLHGRIMAVIDVYDALVSERPYKKPFTHEKAIEIITEDAGTHFDPLIADVFAKISERIKSAGENYKNAEEF
ncbi:MAG: response regulator [Oscillospiraceae bacterium]|nr:response regulator [Oscillospiraceae bacterium]